jgi:hypothetical protein
VQFWFTPVDAIALHRIRFFFGIFFLASLLPFAGHQNDLLGLGGWFDQQAYGDIASLPEGSPFPISWSIYYLCGTSAILVDLVYWLSIVVLALFTLGILTRLTSVLTWVALASFTSNPAIAYDGDYLLTMPAFYLMMGYVLIGQRQANQSLLSRVLGPGLMRTSNTNTSERDSGPVESVGANLALRLLQVHFAIVMLASGFHKLQIGEWWGGVAFWYPLYPPFETTADMVRRHATDATSFLTMLSVAGYATLAWQIGFACFAWRPRWRPILIGGAILAWLGNAFLYWLPLFGPGTFICCLSYLTPEEWQRLNGRVARIPGLGWLDRRATTSGEEPGVMRSKAEAVAS